MLYSIAPEIIYISLLSYILCYSSVCIYVLLIYFFKVFFKETSG